MGHYFTNDKDLRSNVIIHEVFIGNRKFLYKTDHGVFSKKDLDFGSKLLIETLLTVPYTKVLDLGCGYGPIGITLKVYDPKAIVEMVDINERAIELAKENASLNNVYTNVYISDGFEKVINTFDTIVTNPPIRQGKKIIYKFFLDAKNHLTENGAMYFVMQKKQGALSAIKFCKDIYSSVEVINKKSGYSIIKCCL